MPPRDPGPGNPAPDRLGILAWLCAACVAAMIIFCGLASPHAPNMKPGGESVTGNPTENLPRTEAR